MKYSALLSVLSFKQAFNTKAAKTVLLSLLGTRYNLKRQTLKVQVYEQYTTTLRIAESLN